MADIRYNPNMKPKSVFYDQGDGDASSSTKKQPSAKGLGGNLQDLNLDDDSDYEDMEDIEMTANVLAEKIRDEEDDYIMCCCKKHERHDETMKFVCL